MLVVFGGSILGLVFFFGGLTGVAGRLRLGVRSVRLRRKGVKVDAEILSRRGLPAHGDDSFIVTGQWTWGHKNYRGEFAVSERWWENHGGVSIPIRIDPDHPSRSTIADGATRAWGKLLLAVAFLVMAVVGAGFLIRSATLACDGRVELLGDFCDSLRAVT